MKQIYYCFFGLDVLAFLVMYYVMYPRIPVREAHFEVFGPGEESSRT